MTQPTRAPLALVGPGAAGTALAAALSRSGWPIAGVVARTPARAREVAAQLGVRDWGASEAPHPDFRSCSLVLLAVRDDELGGVAAALARQDGWAETVVLHLSGALGADELSSLRGSGAHVGAFHPLMTFPATGAAEPAPLPGDTPFFFEGDEPAGKEAAALAAALGCPFHRISPEAKTAYHCAATVAGNLSTLLLHAGAELLAGVGVPEGEGVLAPLARESVAAGARLGGAAALTGPLARGDEGTLRRHLAAPADGLRLAGAP